jgi:hypothetical protein
MDLFVFGQIYLVCCTDPEQHRSDSNTQRSESHSNLLISEENDNGLDPQKVDIATFPKLSSGWKRIKLKMKSKLLEQSCCYVSNLPIEKEMLHSKQNLKLLSKHSKISILRSLLDFSTVENASYFDPVGDGNCAYYCIIFLLYKDLANEKSSIHQILFDFRRFENENFSTERLRSLAKAAKDVLVCNKNFFELERNQMLNIIAYIRNLAFAEIMANDIFSEYYLSSYNEVYELVNDMYSFISHPILKAIANLFELSIDLILINSDKTFKFLKDEHLGRKLTLILNRDHYQAVIADLKE